MPRGRRWMNSPVSRITPFGWPWRAQCSAATTPLTLVFANSASGHSIARPAASARDSGGYTGCAPSAVFGECSSTASARGRWPGPVMRASAAPASGCTDTCTTAPLTLTNAPSMPPFGLNRRCGQVPRMRSLCLAVKGPLSAVATGVRGARTRSRPLLRGGPRHATGRGLIRSAAPAASWPTAVSPQMAGRRSSPPSRSRRRSIRPDSPARRAAASGRSRRFRGSDASAR